MAMHEEWTTPNGTKSRSSFWLLPLGRRMVEENTGLAYQAAHRCDCGLDRDERISIALHALTVAVAYYRPHLGHAFSTYATYCVRNEIKRAASSPRYRALRIRIDVVEPSCEPDDVPDHDPQLARLTALVDALPDRQREIIRRRFGFGFVLEPETLGAIGDSLGITKERVRQLQEKAKVRLRRDLAAAMGVAP